MPDADQPAGIADGIARPGGQRADGAGKADQSDRRMPVSIEPSDCQPMQRIPAVPSTRDGASRINGVAPWSRLPIRVTATGRKPMISEVMAMPPSCTALASRT